MAILFQLRRGSAASWNGNNTILANGEPGFEADTGRLKIGDGTTAWNSLGYVLVGNSTAVTYGGNTLAVTPYITTQNTTGVATINPYGVSAGNTTVTTAPSLTLQNSVSVALLNSSNLLIGNSTVTTAPTIAVQNSTTNSTLSGVALNVGAALTVNSTGLNHTGTINAASVNATSYTGGNTTTGTGGIVANSTTLFIGNNAINTSITTSSITVNGSIFVANSTGVKTSGSINAASGTITTNTFNIGIANVGTAASSNGYATLPNGLLMLWGSVSGNFTGAGTVVTFSTATGTSFSVNCFSVVTSGNVAPTSYGGTGAYAINATAFTVVSACTSTTVSWIAIGK